MAVITALLTSAAVTTLVTWNDVNDNRFTTSSTVSDDMTVAFEVATSTDVRSYSASNQTDLQSPKMTPEDLRLRLTTRRPVDDVRSQRIAITRSIRLYGIVVAACVATVLAVAMAAACVVARGSSSTAVHWGSWFHRFNRRSPAHLAVSACPSDGDYIYRPLGTGTGSRLDDEYETTFVGVSVPLLHDVRAVW